jgi:hypothetical protein
VSALELVGKPVVVRGLTVDARWPGKRSGNFLPPRVALVAKAINPLTIFVKLRMGGARRWQSKGRLVALAQVVRLATPREVTLGMVVDPLAPAVAS